MAHSGKAQLPPSLEVDLGVELGVELILTIASGSNRRKKGGGSNRRKKGGGPNRNWSDLYRAAYIDSLRDHVINEPERVPDSPPESLPIELLALVVNGIQPNLTRLAQKRSAWAAALAQAFEQKCGDRTMHSPVSIQRWATLLVQTDPVVYSKYLPEILSRGLNIHENVSKFLDRRRGVGLVDDSITRWKKQGVLLSSDKDPKFGRLDARLLHLTSSGYAHEALQIEHQKRQM